MMRMVFEIAMIFSLAGGIFFVTKVLAKEKQQNDNEQQ